MKQGKKSNNNNNKTNIWQNHNFSLLKKICSIRSDLFLLNT